MMTPDTAAPQTGSPWRTVLIVAGGLALVLMLYLLRAILAPFVIAFALAYILSPLVDRLESYGVSRTVSILCIFGALFACLGTLTFVAGGRVGDEIIELSNRFTRKEATERELALTCLSERSVEARLRWSKEGTVSAFTVLSPADRVVRLAPGETVRVRIRFAPKDTARVRAVLLVDPGGGAAPARVELVGNVPGTPASAAVGKGSYRTDGLSVETTLLDFGLAGPNLITSLSESAKRVQPLLQRYLGEDFDVARMITVGGRGLINQRVLGSTTHVLGGVFSGLTFVVIVPFIAFFFLKEGNSMTHGLVELVPNAYFELCLNLIHQISAQIGGYIRGQIVASGVVATLAVIGLHIIGVDYALPLGLLAGFANMIPFLGPLIGIISASLVVLATGGGLDVVGWVVVLYLFIQAVDNVLVQPTVVARSVEMHPLMVLLAVMVGSQLMGIAGMLVAVPLFGIMKVSAQTLYRGIKGYRA